VITDALPLSLWNTVSLLLYVICNNYIKKHLEL
jgi:hypothetical protein